MELIIITIKAIHIIVSILLILVVLLQPGKSGDLGSVFGGGTSESVFGSSGAVPFLAKVTRGLAVLFLLTSLSLGYIAAKGVNKSVVTDVPSALGEAESDPVTSEDFPEDISPPSGSEEDSTLPGEPEAADTPAEPQAAPAEQASESGEAADATQSGPAEQPADTPPGPDQNTQ